MKCKLKIWTVKLIEWGGRGVWEKKALTIIKGQSYTSKSKAIQS